MEDDHTSKLIIRYLSQEASPEEEEELLEWISKDISHQRIFNEWIEAWKVKSKVEPAFDTAKGLTRLNLEIDALESIPQPFMWRRLAAAVLVLITSSALVLLIAKYDVRSPEISLKDYKTNPGEKITLQLPDGSTVFLNANSSFQYPQEFVGNTREVFLAGEAFFEIVKDAEHPFIVHTNSVATKVLGTSFNVRTYSDSSVVSVATGKVQVIQGSLLENVMPHEKVVYNASQNRLIKGSADLDVALAWKNNTIIFNDSKLSAVAEKLHEVYGFSFAFGNENLKKCQITGRFVDQPIDVVLKAINYSTGTRYQIEGQQVTLDGPGCK